MTASRIDCKVESVHSAPGNCLFVWHFQIIKFDNSSFERVEEFKYLVTTTTNQNYIQKEIKSRLKSGNACYHSVQNLFPSSLLSKNIKIKKL
jgi:hypothetical protein